MWSLALWMTFSISMPMIWNLLQCPKYTKTGINQPSDSLYIWLRFHLMLHLEFLFGCLSIYQCRSWVQFAQLASVPKYTKTGITQPPLPLTKASFDVKCRAEQFEWLLCPWCETFRPNFFDLTRFHKYTKTGITWPSDGFYPSVRLHLMWNVEFETLDDFLCISAHDLG